MSMQPGEEPVIKRNSPSRRELEAALGHLFVRAELLEQALTHTSQARERDAQNPGENAAPDNQQLEFLGDSILGFVAAEELWRRFQNLREGELSKLRAHLVSEKYLVKIARELGLGDHLRLGKSEEKSGGRKKTALLADALEAILAAIYLDGGIEPARRIIVDRIMNPELGRIFNNAGPLPLTDYKSALQEKLHAIGLSPPVYVLVAEHGPEHKKTFTIEARLANPNEKHGSDYVGRAQGSTKKSAEQESARLVLEHLGDIEGNERGPKTPGFCKSL
ncbi:MAG: ribonuclease III [Terriglobales bacterium]